MRLLKVKSDGSFSLASYAGNKTPDYAILSHTWEADDNEVTYQDIVAGVGDTKSGYDKIRFCGKQALKDGIHYMWVDSCCIDRTSSAELSEAINSMFRWYKNAVKCYVYLADVAAAEPRQEGPAPPTFMHSRWFTRGWTLQELIAPETVEFYSQEGHLLGDKESLLEEVQSATSIAPEALQGGSLSQFTIDERMSWAEKRETTLDEDRVYCLLGIFDIHLPLIYGEGFANASRRLREEIEKRAPLVHGELFDLETVYS
jgi:hypothetical protein